MKDLTADHAKNKFNHLRTYHQRELKKIENMPSGSGGQQSSKWEYFNHCSYMQPGGCLYREKSNGKHPPRETEGTQPDQVEENASKKRKLHHSEFSTADTLHQDHLPGNEQFMENRPEAATRPILPCQTSHNNQTTFTTFRPRIEENQTADRYSHQTLILKGLLEDASFADVTLTAEGQSLKAHKAVLSAMSPYFKSVLQNNPSPHPIIIMPLDMQFEDLKGIIDYIYVGDIMWRLRLVPLFKASSISSDLLLISNWMGRVTHGSDKSIVSSPIDHAKSAPRQKVWNKCHNRATDKTKKDSTLDDFFMLVPEKKDFSDTDGEGTEGV
ncbi:uncharacterized protein LOC134788968 [Penaeus indicus]|uniref:uncharacterized protein LOC134788968 n=1 Tax=Penaeus indicus TaxID=29960 RepID=UPI00300CF050